MPWNSKSDVAKHNKNAAARPARAKQWAEVANSVLAKTGDDGRAIREANAVTRDHPARHMHGDGDGSHWSGK